jgi:hypothetical protein
MMLILIIIINLLISSVNFYLVWRLTKLRSKLIIYCHDLNILNTQIKLILPLGSEILTLATLKTTNFRVRYGKIQNKIQIIRTILILVKFLNKFRF